MLSCLDVLFLYSLFVLCMMAPASPVGQPFIGGLSSPNGFVWLYCQIVGGGTDGDDNISTMELS
jgi:hypothetical protein